MRSFVRSIPRRYRQLGAKRFAQLLLFRALNVLQMDFHERATVQEAKEGYAIRLGRSKDLVVFRRMGLRDDLLPDLSVETNIFLVHDGETGPNAYFWLGKIPFDFRRHPWLAVTPEPGDICGRFLWVAPEARGLGIDPALNVAADAHCRQAGYERIVSYVDTFNEASLRADRRVGYDKVVRLTMWRFLGLGWLRFGRCTVVGRFDESRPAVFRFDEIRGFGRLDRGEAVEAP